jgi:PhnB protein
MPLSPYITFSGNCAAAIAFYQQTLGAELIHQITYGEMPQSAQDAEDGCPSGQHLSADCIAHASLRVAGSELMLGDSPGDKTDRYAGFTLVLDPRMWPRASAGSIARRRRERRDGLAGNLLGPRLRQSIDRFGVPWMMNVVKQAKASLRAGSPPCHQLAPTLHPPVIVLTGM